MNEAQIKDWIRENLKLSVKLESNYGPENDVIVGIKFKNEKEAFTEIRISIPEKS